MYPKRLSKADRVDIDDQALCLKDLDAICIASQGSLSPAPHSSPREGNNDTSSQLYILSAELNRKLTQLQLPLPLPLPVIPQKGSQAQLESQAVLSPALERSSLKLPLIPQRRVPAQPK